MTTDDTARAFNAQRDEHDAGMAKRHEHATTIPALVTFTRCECCSGTGQLPAWPGPYTTPCRPCNGTGQSPTKGMST